jgi:tRNA 2-selenouridine synthase
MSETDSFDIERLSSLHTEGIPLLDVRSPKEFGEGHIPNAVSFPLMTDDERALIGTCYKQ